MSCPFLRSSQTAQCLAVAGEPLPITPAVVEAFCRGAHARCSALRYLRATGILVHPADFRAWVLRGIPPGRTDPEPEATELNDPR